jgi:hypothetical protein
MYHAIYRPSRDKYDERRKRRSLEEWFTCIQCAAQVYTQAMISGVQNRNHCPYCLCSRHMDQSLAGDRLSACRAIMQPIGLTVKPSRNKYGVLACGELMLIHRCSDCGKLSINRLAADDQVERLMEIFLASQELEMGLILRLRENGIQLLTKEDFWLVKQQLVGSEKR